MTGDDCFLWDEYQRPIYALTAVISDGEMKDSKTVSFGMRKFAVNGTQFEINGRTTFLRASTSCSIPADRPPSNGCGRLGAGVRNSQGIWN